MAIDTRNKRASCIGIDLAWNRVFPNPDGTINVNDRQQIGLKYAGTLGVSSAVDITYYRCLLGVGI